jgi:hypothetical protein
MVWYLLAVANHIALMAIRLSNHSVCFVSLVYEMIEVQSMLFTLDTSLVIILIHHTARFEIPFLFFLPSTAL